MYDIYHTVSLKWLNHNLINNHCPALIISDTGFLQSMTSKWNLTFKHVISYIH